MSGMLDSEDGWPPTTTNIMSGEEEDAMMNFAAAAAEIIDGMIATDRPWEINTDDMNQLRALLGAWERAFVARVAASREDR